MQVQERAVDQERILTSAMAAVAVRAAFIELDDPEANAALRRHWPHEREWMGPDGSDVLPEPRLVCDRLEAITETYGLDELDGFDRDAILAAAFVVQQDLVPIAEYAAKLEQENHQLRTRLGLA